MVEASIASSTTSTRMCLSAQMNFGIARWNDTPGRTHDEVLAAFDRAIADA